MARTAQGAALTSRHRTQQMALRAATLRDLSTLWPIWRVGDDKTYERFLLTAATLVRSRHGDSAGIAAAYYERFRAAEKVPGGADVKLAPPPEMKRVVASIDSTGRAALFKALGAGQSLPAARQNGFVQLSGSVARHVLNGARDTIVGSSFADPRADGWQRITGGSPCYFCAMLASRGPSYSEAGSDFQAHDHCACSAEPVYGGSEMSQQSREFRRMWNETTRGASGKDAIRAFRKAFESR